MLINKEQWGIENAPFWEERIPRNNYFCDRDLQEHTLNYSQYVVSDTNKHFTFELDRKLNP